MKQQRPYPRVYITKKGASALKGGHPWVFAGEVVETEPSADGRPITNGHLVDVFEKNGTWQGAGLISEQSKIRVRLVTRNANDRPEAADGTPDADFWRRRCEWAWQHRVVTMGGRAIPGTASDISACRVIFSEADGFPGLTIDRYGSVLVSQVGTVGMELLRGTIYPILLDVLRADGQDVQAIYERNDGATREHEGLPRYKGWWDGAPAPASPRLLVEENGIRFDLDIENSQKTGFFLDQKYNRRAVRELASGRRVLDCFCHVGPFGLNALAGGAAYVREVDASKTAISLAKENARLNGVLPEDAEGGDKIGFTVADVLNYLPMLHSDRAFAREQGGPFDLIILDPPAFTKSSHTVRNALHGYREINYEALRLLPRGGYLATCSCSQHMTRDLLARAISEAARDANVQLKQVEERQQAPDHPILWGFPESHYLDFFIFQVV